MGRTGTPDRPRIDVVGLGAGEEEPTFRPSSGRAFVPDGASRLRRRLGESGVTVLGLSRLDEAGRGDAVFLPGGPEAADPWLGRLRRRFRVRLFPGESLLCLVGGEGEVVDARSLAAGRVPLRPTVVVGLPAEGHLPLLLPDAEVLVLQGGEEVRRVAADAVDLGRLAPGDVVAVPEQAVPPLEEMGRLLVLMARLRAPGGCPWDRAQDHRSLRPYLLEEAAEAVDALSSGKAHKVVEELGDLLLQVVFHAQIGRENATFDFADVCRSIADKLVRRHPHVFGSARLDDADEVLRRWEELKAEEGRRRPSEKIAKAQGAVERAEKLAALLGARETAEDGHPLWSGVRELVRQGRRPSLELRDLVDRLLARLDEEEGDG